MEYTYEFFDDYYSAVKALGDTEWNDSAPFKVFCYDATYNKRMAIPIVRIADTTLARPVYYQNSHGWKRTASHLQEKAVRVTYGLLHGNSRHSIDYTRAYLGNPAMFQEVEDALDAYFGTSTRRTAACLPVHDGKDLL